MHKLYFNWKLVRLIKELIGYVENDKMKVKLINKLQGIEEPKRLIPFYRKAVYDAVNAYNHLASRGYYRPLRVEQDCLYIPYRYDRKRMHVHVSIIQSSAVIAYKRMEFYDYQNLTRETALELCFKEIFTMITLTGLDMLAQMYNHGIFPHEDSASKRALIEHQANLLKGGNALAATNGWHDDRDDFKNFLANKVHITHELPLHGPALFVEAHQLIQYSQDPINKGQLVATRDNRGDLYYKQL